MKSIMKALVVGVVFSAFVSCSEKSVTPEAKVKPAVDPALIGRWALCMDSVTVMSSGGDTLVATADTFKIMSIIIKDYTGSTAYYTEAGNIVMWVGGTNPTYVYDYRIVGNKLLLTSENTASVPVPLTYTTPSVVIYQKIP
ncbi:MAG: hypothetical protein JNL74_17415 [Fibrobacteres bacterium]|nr:hypothetical protein [Fibrobacterota bacterium]